MNKKFTHRERVVTSLEHREPDRVPMGIWCTLPSYINLRKHLGLAVKDTYPVGSTTWSRDVPAEEDLIEKLDLDIIRICMKTPGGPPALRETPDGLFVDEWGVRRKLVPYATGSYLEIVDPPLKDATVKDLEDYPYWPDPHDPEVTEGLVEKVKRIRKETDLAILAQFGRGGIYEQAKYLRGYDTIHYDMAVNPEFVLALHEKLTQIEMEWNKVGIELVGQDIDILRLSPEDLATAENLFVSPKMFDKFILSFYRESFAQAKQLLKQRNPNAKIQFHSCGAAFNVMPELIEIGMDVFDPVQPRVADYSKPARYKEAYGDRLAFWGGIDVQVTLPRGSKEDVIEEVKTRIRELAPGGGYILSSSHRTQEDIPAENIVTMFEAAHEYGRYPIRV